MRWTISLAILICVSGQAQSQPQAASLVAAEPVPNAPAGMKAWRIRYVTRDDRGLRREATGMVVAPEQNSTRTRRVIAWAHGTVGVAEKCGPSNLSRFFELTPALEAVRRGYVVVAPDYIGLGNKGPHPYLVGTITARAVLDSVKAAREIEAARAGSEFAVWGESQGGHAALWTGQLASVEGGDLRLVGVAAAAPPTDLAANFRGASDPSAKAFLTALAADSWSRYYNVPLVVGRRGTPYVIGRMAANCILPDTSPKFGAILGLLTLRRDLQNVDFAGTRPWTTYVEANSLTPVSRYPILIAQAVADPLVAPQVTRAFARRLCANKVAVRWIDVPGKEHARTAFNSASPTLQWIADRFEKRPPPSDCGRI